MSELPNTNELCGVATVDGLSERVQDLLVERTLWGLGRESETELSVAIADVDGTAYEFERTVGALCVGMLTSDAEQMPSGLRSRLLGLAETDAVRGAIGGGVSGGGVSETGSARHDSVSARLTFTEEAASATSPERSGALQWFGWVAAAACLAFAMFVTMPESGPVPINVAGNLVARVEDAGDVIRSGWAGLSALGAPNHTLDRGVVGEVVWSDDLDEGFMTISGIEANDPSEFQYQLWIFDAERRTGDLPQFAADSVSPLLTQRPVDGGVFDVTVSDDGTVVVPIDAKLPIGKAAIFAVTKEPPGGVVVSDRDIVFLALRG